MTLGRNPELTARLRFTDEAAAIEDIVKAINTAKGNVQNAAKALGVAKRTLFLWAKDYPKIRDALDKARRKRVREATE